MSSSEAFLWRHHCTDIFEAALAAVDPERATHRCLQLKDNILTADDSLECNLDNFSKIMVLGAGKASYTMAKAVENILKDRITSGLIVTKTGHGKLLKNIEVAEGSHPLPSVSNMELAEKMLSMAQSAKEDTLVIFLMSGGASALLPAPSGNISLDDKLAVTSALLSCGASIHEINCIRKHMSRIKGGHLLQTLMPADCLCLVLSDVVGDNLHSIGSGPLVSDPTTFSDGLNIFEKYNLKQQIPETVLNHFLEGQQGKLAETMTEDEFKHAKCRHVLIGSNSMAVEAASNKATELGFNTLLLSTTFEGETKDLARFFSAIAQYRRNRIDEKPLLILGGGETTVTIKGSGKGGRNQEFALAMVSELPKLTPAFAAGFATDGTDGPTDAAGAWCDHLSLQRAGKLSMHPAAFLKNNDGYNFFKKLEDLIITGPTGTNVCDLYLLGLY